MASRTPLLSVVIPTHDNLAALRQCLDSWRRFTAAERVELLVIEDACDDGTPAYLAQVAKTPWCRKTLRVFHEADVHELRCDNRGFAEARGSLLLAWQDDMFVRAGWFVPEVLRAFARIPELGMLGLIRGLRLFPLVHPLERWADLHRPQHLESTLGPGGPLNWFRLAEVDSVVRPWVVRRACLDAVGPLNEAFVPTEWDEADLAYRVRRAGWAVATHGYERLGAFFHVGSATVGRELAESYKARALRNGQVFRERWEATIHAEADRMRRTWARPLRPISLPALVARAAAAGAGRLRRPRSRDTSAP